MNLDRMPKLLSVGDVARQLRGHPATVRRWVDNGKIPSFKTPGGHRRVTLADVERAIDETSRELGR